MNLQTEKLRLVKMIIDTDDQDVIKEVKSIFESRSIVASGGDDMEEFYEGFRDGVREVKSSLDGKIELTDAKTWLDGLQD